MLGNAKQGDLTIAINCQAYQEETPEWTTFSDAHDVVITPVRLPEIQELLLEAGFSDTVIYWEGTDDETGEGDGEWAVSKRGEACEGWVAYIVGIK